MSEIVIVGAGPAGMAAAVAASSQNDTQVTVIDDNPSAGGQIWRGGADHKKVVSLMWHLFTNPWFDRLSHTRAKVLTGARVILGDAVNRSLVVECNGQVLNVPYTKLILATGARELFLPFPGWTLPNVIGAGGLQALVKSGLPVAGKRIVVAGSGPLLLAVAAHLKKQGAIVPLIAEQASLGSLARFTAGLLAHPNKLWQAFQLNPLMAGIQYLTECWVEAALGTHQVERVRLRQKARVWEEPCDYLANAYGFVPNSELATLLGCSVEGGIVRVNESQQTSFADIYCAGEAAGIGGVDTALLEGQIAGYSATGQTVPCSRLQRQLRKARSFARSLNRAFVPRVELQNLAQPDTIVCRCEDVTLARLRTANSWRSAKLHERCGMGPCQGRICGPAVQFILGWEPSSVRPPIFPVRLDTLLQENSVK